MKEEIEFDDYTYVNNGLVNTWMDKYRCKKCGHLGAKLYSSYYIYF